VSDYPVKVTYAEDEGQNRLWGIPLLGLIVRTILCIPQAIVLAILVLVLYVIVLLNWIPILFNGRQAGWIYSIAGGLFRLSLRVSAYILLITGRYPPFGLGGEHTVDVTLGESEAQNRLWGIPIVGVMIRAILLIPHLIVLTLLGIVVGILALFTWVPVLLTGRTADWVVRWVGGFYRWSFRVYAYAFLLTGRYPPFSLDD
jgi:hypothetical protein